ncbi:MAG: hypothetical protein FJX76_14790 [Armatimonadetes bacterium]|nr:hypothetical protein [Armatimonadota bacterium]
MARAKPPAAESQIVVNLAPGTEAAPEQAPAAAKRKKHKPHPEEDLERWLLTYCDLITLLMAMFVIMYANSRVKEGQKGISVEMDRIQNITAKDKRFLPVIPDEEIRKIERLRLQIDSLKKMKKIGPFIHLTKSSKGLIISMEGDLMFDSGSAEMKPEAKRVIDLLVPTWHSVNNAMRIEGHTDNVPINTEAYPSNWHLSTARAISVVDYLVHKHRFNQDRFSALGYADLKPVKPNSSGPNRAKNRRVDIVVLVDQSAGKN